jgi:hypothetical protein
VAGHRLCGDALPQPFCGLDGLHRTDVGQEHGELVAAEPAERLPGAHGRPEPLGQRVQDAVADLMAACVVDLLEVVDVHQDQRELAVAAPHASQRLRLCGRGTRGG